MTTPALLAALAILTASAAIAQTKDPTLTEMCRLYDAVSMSIDSQRMKAAKPIREQYLTALSDVEKGATAKNDAAELAIISKLRQQADNPQAESVVASRSNALKKAHSDYLAAKAKIDAEYQTKREAKYSELLLTLDAYEKTLAADSPTLKEIATVRKNVANIPKWGAGPTTQKKAAK